MTSQAGPAPDTDARTAPVDDATDVGIWWDELVAVSMLGTARRDPPPLPAALGIPDPTGPREDRLLAAATAAMVLRSAGRRPEPTRDVPAAAPEPRPPASPRAVQVLDLLVGQRPLRDEPLVDLVRRWCRRCAAAGRVVPAATLPALLDFGSRTVAARPDIVAVAGTVGDLLARSFPEDLAWLADRADPDRADPNRADPDRADPDRADPDAPAAEPGPVRVGAEPGDWAHLPAAGRLAFLERIAESADPAWEPLLEASLDDRAKTVRDRAAAALATMPGSALSARMTDRLRPLLRTERRMVGRRLAIDLPAAPDAAARRDGLRPGGLTEAHRRLSLLVECAPLTLWTELTGRAPGAALDLIAHSQASDGVPRTVQTALATAAVRQRDPAWAAALLEILIDPRLVALLESAEQDRWLARRVDRLSPDSLRALLEGLPAWGLDLSRRYLNRLLAEQEPTRLGHPANVVSALHPGARADAERAIGRLRADRGDLVGPLAEAIQFQTLAATIDEEFR